MRGCFNRVLDSAFIFESGQDCELLINCFTSLVTSKQSNGREKEEEEEEQQQQQRQQQHKQQDPRQRRFTVMF